MPLTEMIAEMRAAASVLMTAADNAENGDLIAAGIAVEDSLFRTQSILGRLRQAALARDADAAES
jgi:hypothetical protein